MASIASRLPLQVGYPYHCVVQSSRLAPFCLLLGILCGASSAQTVQGLPAVGNGTTQSSSQMLIDATAFPSTDMCGSIALACAQLGKTNYPLGANIDARGFTGTQVCKASSITTMLFQCVPPGTLHGATGGKLLLGEVNLFADGPIPPATSYTDGTSGVGTPALIIPYGFWGIEGVSRGANGKSTPASGTSLSVCTGSGTPVSACQHGFPVRSFTVNSTTVSTASGVTTMTMNVTPPANFGVNIYPGELVMMKGNSSDAGC
jgi:hypothetical protein